MDGFINLESSANTCERYHNTETLNEEETTYYFNKHLDQLEEKVSFSLKSGGCSKFWKPFKLNPSPVINVVTRLKIVNCNKQAVTYLDEKELKIKKICDRKPIHAVYKIVKDCSSDVPKLTELKDITPNNSPDILEINFCDIKENSLLKRLEIYSEGMSSRRCVVVVKALKLKKRKNRLVSCKIFKKRIKNVNYCKPKRLATKSALIKKYADANCLNVAKKDNTSCLKIDSKVDDIDVMKNEADKKEKLIKFDRKMNKSDKINKADKNDIDRSSLKVDRKVDELGEVLKETSINCLKVYKKVDKSDIMKREENTSLKVDRKLDVSDEMKKIKTEEPNQDNLRCFTLHSASDNNKNCKLKASHCKTTKNENVKAITPKIVGLNINATNHNSKIVSNEVQRKEISSKKQYQEQLLYNRYLAQQEIIEEQNYLIKQLKKDISNLKIHNVQIQSKLQLKTVQANVAAVPSTFDNKHKPVVKTLLTECGKILPKGQTNIVDHSKVLTKSLTDRQEYCKQLAEMTRMRKIRKEEEKVNQKLEMEEKDKQHKEEQKRICLLKKKFLEQLAKENAKNLLNNKIYINNLTYKAINHFNRILMRKAFTHMKSLILEISIKSNHCDELYKRKLLRSVFTNWRQETSHLITLKQDFADSFYKTKLMRLAWTKWYRLQQDYRIKVQVSEDMCSLKLQERTFKMWKEFTAQQYLQTSCKMELAERLHRRKLLKHYFGYWRIVPKLMFIDREREQRRRAWRVTVQQLIPDFSPVFADQTFEV